MTKSIHKRQEIIHNQNNQVTPKQNICITHDNRTLSNKAQQKMLSTNKEIEQNERTPKVQRQWTSRTNTIDLNPKHKNKYKTNDSTNVQCKTKEQVGQSRVCTGWLREKKPMVAPLSVVEVLG